MNLFAVCDGMGGHNAGEVASKMAIEALQSFVEKSEKEKEITWPYGLDVDLSFEGNRLQTAIKLANKARDEAELALNQYYLEKAKVLFGEASAAQGLNADQQRTLEAAGEAIRNAEGRKAYDLLTPLVAEIRASSLQYQVVRGDSLWSISGQRQVYNNPYQWPLIYKANRDKIKDADLIYPGQTFSVDRNPSAGDAAAAIDHAKNRGAWSIGVVEQSDRRYLGGSLELQ
jgi:nucleoid-associated protein YgaU